jgi:hypothetical protein
VKARIGLPARAEGVAAADELQLHLTFLGMTEAGGGAVAGPGVLTFTKLSLLPARHSVTCITFGAMPSKIVQVTSSI